MIKTVSKYLSLDNVDLYCIFVALYPIMSGYGWGVLHGNLVFILILAIWGLIGKRKVNFSMKWLQILIIFVFIHEFLLMMMISVQSYFINNTISVLMVCLSIIPIARSVNYKKFVGSLNWIAIISILGLIYQFTFVLRGQPITPLKIPFLPGMESTTRLYEESIRPSSFFWEPAALVTFLMVPMFISLRDKKYIWTIVIISAMFLSTSSTGILMSMVMLAVYVLTQKIKFWTRVFVVTMGLGLVYGLIHSSYFSAGVEKIQNTDTEKNARLMNGFFLINAMEPEDFITGIKAANVDEFFDNNGAMVFRGASGSVFVPTFWVTLGKYGIIGLLLLLTLYFQFARRDKTTLPYIIVLFISMFFQSASTIGGSIFAFQLIFMYSYVNYSSKKHIA